MDEYMITMLVFIVILSYNGGYIYADNDNIKHITSYKTYKYTPSNNEMTYKIQFPLTQVKYSLYIQLYNINDNHIRIKDNINGKILKSFHHSNIYTIENDDIAGGMGNTLYITISGSSSGRFRITPLPHAIDKQVYDQEEVDKGETLYYPVKAEHEYVNITVKLNVKHLRVRVVGIKPNHDDNKEGLSWLPGEALLQTAPWDYTDKHTIVISPETVKSDFMHNRAVKHRFCTDCLYIIAVTGLSKKHTLYKIDIETKPWLEKLRRKHKKTFVSSSKPNYFTFYQKLQPLKLQIHVKFGKNSKLLVNSDTVPTLHENEAVYESNNDDDGNVLIKPGDNDWCNGCTLYFAIISDKHHDNYIRIHATPFIDTFPQKKSIEDISKDSYRYYYLHANARIYTYIIKLESDYKNDIELYVKARRTDEDTNTLPSKTIYDYTNFVSHEKKLSRVLITLTKQDKAHFHTSFRRNPYCTNCDYIIGVYSKKDTTFRLLLTKQAESYELKRNIKQYIKSSVNVYAIPIQQSLTSFDHVISINIDTSYEIYVKLNAAAYNDNDNVIAKFIGKSSEQFIINGNEISCMHGCTVFYTIKTTVPVNDGDDSYFKVALIPRPLDDWKTSIRRIRQVCVNKKEPNVYAILPNQGSKPEKIVVFATPLNENEIVPRIYIRPLTWRRDLQHSRFKSSAFATFTNDNNYKYTNLERGYGYVGRRSYATVKPVCPKCVYYISVVCNEHLQYYNLTIRPD